MSTAHSSLLGRGESPRDKLDSNIRETIPISRHISHDTWRRMANALRVLKASGFDVGEAENYLPMIEQEVIHPSMEGEVFRFYKHLQKRLEAESQVTEPIEIVEAALGFVEGYEELKNLQAFPVLG